MTFFGGLTLLALIVCATGERFFCDNFHEFTHGLDSFVGIAALINCHIRNICIIFHGIQSVLALRFPIDPGSILSPEVLRNFCCTSDKSKRLLRSLQNRNLS